MAHVLGMAAIKLGDPVSLVILVEADYYPLHRNLVGTVVKL